MYILNVRSELIAYYERRGYIKQVIMNHIRLTQMLDYHLYQLN